MKHMPSYPLKISEIPIRLLVELLASNEVLENHKGEMKLTGVPTVKKGN